ncbi:hypothetical protein AE07_04226 [Enterobacter cloacae BWH 43]|nr:hypothetical protein AE07_04226 [Enterobacter cloacae BWH 43]
MSSCYQNNSAVQNAFLDQMAVAIGKNKQVINVMRQSRGSCRG